MQNVDILLESSNPDLPEMEAELKEHLKGLRTIRYKSVSKSVEPGTLSPEAQQVVGFVIEHYDKLIPLVTATLTIIKLILSRRKKPPKPPKKDKVKKTKEPKVVVIVVGENKLALPASKAQERNFVKNLESQYGRSNQE